MKKWLIYKHTLTVEGPYYGWSYIGQTCNSLTRRFSNGNGYLRNQRDAAFGKAVLQFGWENFEHEILEQDLDSKELADERERFWILYFNTYIGDPNCKGFNSTRGGDSWGTLGRIKIYKPSTEKFMFIREHDLPDYESLGWEKWYTLERKRQLRKKYYEEHREHELTLSKTNNVRYRTELRKTNQVPEPKIKVNLNKDDFDTYEEYYSAYLKEYGKLYRAKNKEKLNKQSSAWQKVNKERTNQYSKAYYYRKKEAMQKSDSNS